jgi:hypothetical protein
MKNPISRILLLGSLLYFLMGLAICYATAGMPKQFLGFLFMPLFSGTVALMLEKTKVDEQISGWFFVFCLQATIVFHYFLFPDGLRNAHIITSILMLIAAVDSGMILSKKQNMVNLISTSIFTISLGLLYEHVQSLMVTAPVILLLIWKFLLGDQLAKIIAHRVEARQLDAFKATVVSLNHEFNNVVAICEATLSKGKIEGNFSAEDSDVLQRNLRRLVDLVKRLRKVERYEELDYFEGRKMVHIPELSEKE